jgi:hypothetical protein
MQNTANYSKFGYFAYIPTLDVGVEFSEDAGLLKRQGASGNIWFSERDCTGLAYGVIVSNHQLSETMSDGTVFRGKSTGPKNGQSLRLQSFINSTQRCQNMQPQGISNTIFEAEKILLPFNEPVTAPVEVLPVPPVEGGVTETSRPAQITSAQMHHHLVVKHLRLL